MDEITIQVTDEDIANGERGNAHTCAVALAMQRELVDCDIEVSYTWISVEEDPDNFTIYDLPKEAKQFISDFDGGLVPVEPIKFIVTKREAIRNASD